MIEPMKFEIDEKQITFFADKKLNFKTVVLAE